MKNWFRNHKFKAIDIVITVTLAVAGILVSVYLPEIRESLGLDAFVLYESKNPEFSIKYPKAWNKDVSPNIVNKEVVKFITPKESNSDTFQERLIVSVEGEKDMSLEDYTNLSKQEISNNAKIIEESNYTLADKAGYMVIYTNTDGKHKLKKMEVWTIKNNDKAYSIIYEAEADKFDKFRPIAEKMIKSLQIP